MRASPGKYEVAHDFGEVCDGFLYPMGPTEAECLLDLHRHFGLKGLKSALRGPQTTLTCLEIAVGNRVAPVPPHRSGRAR